MKRSVLFIVLGVALVSGCVKDGPQIVSGPSGAPHPALLVRAAEGGNYVLLRDLISQGADLGATDQGGETAVFRAAQNGHVDCAVLLLDSGASVSAARAKDGFEPIHIAAARGHAQMVETLIDHGASANARDSQDMTPLMLASEKGHKLVVEMLLKKGADPDLKDGKGRTALVIARNEGNAEVVNVLEASATLTKR